MKESAAIKSTDDDDAMGTNPSPNLPLLPQKAGREEEGGRALYISTYCGCCSPTRFPNGRQVNRENGGQK